MGLYRNRFLRQKEGNYTCPITLGELVKDYNEHKKRIKIDEGGNSFFFSEKVMERALKNLLDWNFLTFSRSSDRTSIITRDIDSRYGPEDIYNFYTTIENVPSIVEQIFRDF